MDHKHLLGIDQLSSSDIDAIFKVADNFLEIARRPVKRVPTLRGWTVMNCFFEASTRTRMSFELAAKRLGADSINFATGGSSISKGETLLDTARNLEAMAPDVLIVRDSRSGTPHYLADRLGCSVINAGDGRHEHPTQALLDGYTMRQKKGGLKGLKVAIIGDIEYSRVARSNVLLLPKMGAEVTLCGSPTLLPNRVDSWNVKVTHSMEEAVEGKDVIMMLRIQRERQGKLTVPSLREYFTRYGLTRERLTRAAKDVLIMHPGPMNRGVEIASDVADGPESVILEQVTNGVAVRMAVLYLVTVGRGKDETAH
ncbi:MAG TPA: aspartate carbamoyltransferase catalytic subunit [Thermoanaerobaculia bacterium]|nr:aspartate carbamoyltransferase catalytic subunit [Thermoanaerobaculia bacterium]HUM28948.1 aspartate carbamoyltransferase catalytic subunit [Thermoanaerobaculia bacterium]HXK67120.1 aspartate carbamoyltransferase catalytic subunit [Thermoanaerobaculia bacterium]